MLGAVAGVELCEGLKLSPAWGVAVAVCDADTTGELELELLINTMLCWILFIELLLTNLLIAFLSSDLDAAKLAVASSSSLAVRASTSRLLAVSASVRALTRCSSSAIALFF